MRPYHSLLNIALAAIVCSCLCSCGAESEEEPVSEVKTRAEVETFDAEEITQYSAIISGEITDDGNCEILTKGFCWAEYNEIPWFDSTRYGVSVIEGDDINFRDTIELSPGKKYFIRTFVKNEIGTNYGNTIIVTTLGDKPSFFSSATVTDVDCSSAKIGFAVNDNLLLTTVTVKYGRDDKCSEIAFEESFTGQKEFTVEIKELELGIKYYYKIAIENSLGRNSATGDFKTLTPDCVDIDGNVYKTVRIGDQVWTARNLDVTRYNDGTAIPYVTSDEDWLQAGEDKMGARCFYNNDPELRKIYGTLYNWYAIDTKKLAPEGWHVPTNEEWNELLLTLCKMSSEGSGLPLRETGTEHWKAPNTGATNASGFTALPSGFRGITKNGILEFSDLTTDVEFWSADHDSVLLLDGYTRIVYTSYNTDTFWNYLAAKQLDGMSIRLVKD